MEKGISKAPKPLWIREILSLKTLTDSQSREASISADLLPTPFLGEAQESPLLSPITLSRKYVYHYCR